MCVLYRLSSFITWTIHQTPPSRNRDVVPDRWHALTSDTLPKLCHLQNMIFCKKKVVLQHLRIDWKCFSFRMVIFFFVACLATASYLRNIFTRMILPYGYMYLTYETRILDDADDSVDQIEDSVQFLFLISHLCLCLSEDASVSVPIHFGHFFNNQIVCIGLIILVVCINIFRLIFLCLLHPNLTT